MCKIARANHHVVEQAPGDGRFSRRPLLGTDRFVFNTKRRGFETGSKPGRTCRPRATRWSDGPASQARHHGRPASSSVHTRNSTKRRAALSKQAHNMAQRPGEQGPRRDTRVAQGVPESSGAGGRRTANLNRPRKPEVDREGNSFRNAQRKDTKNRKENPSGGSPLTLEIGSDSSLGPNR